MGALLKDRGMDLSIFCSVCNLDDESTEHVLLCYARVRLIWRIAGSQTWEEIEGLWLGPFLNTHYQSSAKVTGRFAYITYQI